MKNSCNCNTSIIDEWNGWIWFCITCENEGRKATDEELEDNNIF